MKLLRPLLLLLGLLLAACGAPAPGDAASDLERRQTSVALRGLPTLEPLAAGALPTAAPRPPLPDLSELLQIRPDDPRALGDVNAPVTIIEFTDYE